MFRSSLGWLMLAVGCAALHVACGTDAGDDDTTPDSPGGSSSGDTNGTSSGATSSSSTSSSGSSSGALDAGLDAPSDAADAGSDAAATSGIDAGSDAAAALDLPGAACTGSLTEAELANLYATKPVTGTPSMAWSGSVPGARTLGSYTSAVYKRLCQPSNGCGDWEPQGGEPTMISATTFVRQGSLYLWRESDQYHLGIVSNRVVGGGCSGWTQGKGELQRSESTTVTLATETEHDCQPGTSPSADFNRRNLVDPAGIVAEHCMKLWYSKWFSRTDVGPEAYDEYLAVYDASY